MSKQVQDRHKGEPGCVIAAGPSLIGFDFGRCGDAVTIAVNRMAEIYSDADYMVFLDLSAFKTDGSLRSLIENFRGDVFAPKDFGNHFVHRITEFEQVSEPPFEWPRIFDNRTSSGAALGILAEMGCDPIYLLGCDYRLADNGRHHAHGQGRPYQQSDLDNLRNRMVETIRHYWCRGIEIINVTPMDFEGKKYSRLYTWDTDFTMDLAAFDLRRN